MTGFQWFIAGILVLIVVVVSVVVVSLIKDIRRRR